jgi:uncharacterized glyoxalase superfamily protein PhnB
MRYRDVAGAADWLCEAFGFEKQTVLTSDVGTTVYAQLTFGRALIMLAPVGDSPIEKFMKQPDEIGGAETQSCYFLVADADDHHDQAKAAGAEIILPVEDDDFGGRGYTCRDPEGHIWTFGTYDPWQGRFPEPVVAAPPPPRRGRRFALAGLTMITLVAVGVAAWFGGALTHTGAVIPTARIPKAAAANNAGLEAAEQAYAQLERERAARVSADKASEVALKRAAEAEQALVGAERVVDEARAELEKERKRKADGPSPDLLKHVEDESRAREAAERAVKEARAELEKERKRKADGPSPDLLKRIETESRAREAAEHAERGPRGAGEGAQEGPTRRLPTS